MEVFCEFLQLDHSDPASQYIHIHHPTKVSVSHTLSVEGGLARTLPSMDQLHHVSKEVTNHAWGNAGSYEKRDQGCNKMFTFSHGQSADFHAS